MPRPTVLTPAAKKALLQHLQDGLPITRACALVGVSYSAFRRAMRLGEVGYSRSAGFYRDVQKARGLAEVDALARVREGKPGWVGSAWFLSRSFPERWGRKSASTRRRAGSGVRARGSAEPRPSHPTPKKGVDL